MKYITGDCSQERYLVLMRLAISLIEYNCFRVEGLVDHPDEVQRAIRLLQSAHDGLAHSLKCCEEANEKLHKMLDEK